MYMIHLCHTIVCIQDVLAWSPAENPPEQD